MITKPHTWKRWSGSRQTIVEAVNLAAEELEKWNSFPSRISSRITLKDDTTDSDDKTMTIDAYLESELEQIKRIWIEVKPDYELHTKRKRLSETWSNPTGLDENGNVAIAPLDVPSSQSVSFDMDSQYLSAIKITIADHDKTRVEGLMKRLVDHVEAGKRGPTWFALPGRWKGMAFWGGLLGIWATSIAFLIVPKHHSLPIGWAAAPIFGALIGGGFGEIFPNLEILMEGEKSKYQRFRGAFYAVVLAVILAIAASYIHK